MEINLHNHVVEGSLGRVLEAAGRELLNFIYPARCLGCQTELNTSDQDLCGACWGQIARPPPARCRRCSAPVEWQCRDCDNCSGWEPVFERALVLAPFKGAMQAAIHALKYQHQLRLGRALGLCLADVADFQEVWKCVDLLVPVPLHAARRRERGYNQSALIAAGLAAGSGRPVDQRILRRRLPTRQQAKLEAEQRRRNLVDAFTARAVPGCVGLVDDVMTTGATLDAAAAALKAAGCPRVVAIAAASPFVQMR